MDEERSLLAQVGHILLTEFKLAARARVDAANPLVKPLTGVHPVP